MYSYVRSKNSQGDAVLNYLISILVSRAQNMVFLYLKTRKCVLLSITASFWVSPQVLSFNIEWDVLLQLLEMSSPQ